MLFLRYLEEKETISKPGRDLLNLDMVKRI